MAPWYDVIPGRDPWSSKWKCQACGETSHTLWTPSNYSKTAMDDDFRKHLAAEHS